MKIMLLIAGTRGDVEPYFALVRADGVRDHDVPTAVPDNSGAVTTGLGTDSLRMYFAQLISDQGVPLGSFRTLIRPGGRPASVDGRGT